MKNFITPLLNGLRSPFVGSQAPEPPVEDSKPPFLGHKSSFAKLKSPFIGHKSSIRSLKSPFVGLKSSFADRKSPFLRQKVSFSLFDGFKSPFPGSKAPDPLPKDGKSPNPIPSGKFSFSLFKGLKSPFPGTKTPDVITTPAPASVPVPVQEREHIPPYHHLTDYEIGYYDRADGLEAFMNSLPNMPGGYVYQDASEVSGFGDPHLLGLPVNIRFLIYEFMTKPVRAMNKKVILSPGLAVDGFWPKNYFIEPETVFNIIRGLSFRPPSQKNIPEKSVLEEGAPEKNGRAKDGPYDTDTETSEAESFEIEYSEAEYRADWLPSDMGMPDNNMSSFTLPTSNSLQSKTKMTGTDGPIKYCPTSTTLVLDHLSRYLGRSGIGLRHFRLSGFSKTYTIKILFGVSTVGNGPPILTVPDVPPWPRDYPEIGLGITTTDADYMGTIMKFVNDDDDRHHAKRPTSRMAASKKFLRKAISIISLGAATPRMKHPEPSTPFPGYENTPTVYDTDAESVYDADTDNKRQSEGVGLGIQLPAQINKHPLMEMWKVVEDIDRKLDEPDCLPVPEPHVTELWAIDAMSNRIDELFGATDKTKRAPAAPKEPRPPRDLHSMFVALDTLFTGPPRPPSRDLYVFRVGTPNISLAQTPMIPVIHEESEEGTDMSGSPAPTANRDGRNDVYGGLYTVLTNSTSNADNTNISESTLDMPFSDPTIPPWATTAPMHEQEVDSSSTLYLPDDGSETPTMARENTDERGEGREQLETDEYGEAGEQLENRAEQSVLSYLGVQTDGASSTSGSDVTVYRFSTDTREILDWPLPNTTIPPRPTRPAPTILLPNSAIPPPPTRPAPPIPLPNPTAPLHPTRPAPPIPEAQHQLRQIPTATSRRTIRFAEDDDLEQVSTIPSRVTSGVANSNELHEIHTSTSRRTLRFAEPERPDEGEKRDRRPGLREQKKEERKKKEAMFDALDVFLNGGSLETKSSNNNLKKQRSRSGSFWGGEKSHKDAEGNRSQPPLRTARSFPSTTKASEAPKRRRPPTPPPKLKEKRSISRFFARKKDEQERKEGMYGLNQPFHASTANITSGKDTGRRSRTGGLWRRDKGVQQDGEDANTSRPALRNARSFSFVKPLLRRISKANLKASAASNEPAAPAKSAEPRTKSRGFFRRHRQGSQDANAMSSNAEQMSNDAPAAARPGPTPVPRTFSRDSFGHLREEEMEEMEEIEEMSSNLTLLLNGSTSTISATDSNSTGRRSSTGRRGFGGSIFGPRGGRRDGRGSLARVNSRQEAYINIPAEVAEQQEREERERLENEERERLEIEELERMAREEMERRRREEQERLETERLEREEADRLEREHLQRLEAEELARIEREEIAELELQERLAMRERLARQARGDNGQLGI
ncbi:hypothetical protein V495_08510, partial [Pseudogymnoascus sp. VKM F-4514 (FW-929)]